MTKQRIEKLRPKRGKCPTCGAELIEVRANLSNGDDLVEPKVTMLYYCPSDCCGYEFTTDRIRATAVRELRSWIDEMRRTPVLPDDFEV